MNVYETFGRGRPPDKEHFMIDFGSDLDLHLDLDSALIFPKFMCACS